MNSLGVRRLEHAHEDVMEDIRAELLREPPKWRPFKRRRWQQRLDEFAEEAAGILRLIAWAETGGEFKEVSPQVAARVWGKEAVRDA